MLGSSNQKLQADCETLIVLQEECSEVSQLTAKCLRFGMESCHPDTGESNTDRLADEIGDLLCAIDIAMERGLVDHERIYRAKVNKREKLKKWSNIFK